MVKDGRKIAIGVGIAAVAGVILLTAGTKLPPPPGFGRLLGSVIDAVTIQFIPNALVTISRGEQSITIETTTEGLFGVELTLGSYQFLIEKEGYESATRSRTIHEGDNVLDVILVPQ